MTSWIAQSPAVGNLAGTKSRRYELCPLPPADAPPQGAFPVASLLRLSSHQIGMNAVNDGIYLECAIYLILKNHFKSHPSYTQLLELFHEVAGDVPVHPTALSLDDSFVRPPHADDVPDGARTDAGPHHRPYRNGEVASQEPHPCGFTALSGPGTPSLGQNGMQDRADGFCQIFKTSPLGRLSSAHPSPNDSAPN